MTIDQLQRPKFYEGQFLGAEDLTAVVEYGRVQSARHALGAHTWGIAMGLELKEKASPSGTLNVYVQPGYALDGFGRPVVVTQPVPIPVDLFRSITFEAGTDDQNPPGRLISVWLRYVEAATAVPRADFEVCDVEDQLARFQESFRIEIGDKPAHADRHDPVSIAGKGVDAQQALQAFDPADTTAIYDESIPYQTFPGAGVTARWNIPLGVVRWLPSQNPFLAGQFVQRAAQDLEAGRRLRRTLGAVASEVAAVDRMIRLRDRTQAYSANWSDDLVWVEGSLRIEGDARLFGGKLDWRNGVGLDNGVPLKVQRVENNGRGGTDLLVVVGKASAGKNALAIGTVDAANVVSEKVVIQDDGKVGIGTTAPALTLDVRGDFGRDDGAATVHLFGSRIGDTGGGTLFLRSSGGVVAFDGGDRVGIGTATPVASLQVAGDLALESRAQGVARVLPANATLMWNDGTWLRLNQNLDMSKPIFGVHTPGLFAPMSLNVGGANQWGDPGGGNVWVTGSAGITGNVGIGTLAAPQARLQVTGGAIMPAVGNSPAAGIQFPSDPGGGGFDQAFIRYFVQAGETTKLLIGVANDADDTIGFQQFGAERMTIRDGNVGIGTTSPQVRLHVSGSLTITGTARKPGGGSWTSSSDMRLKQHIEPLAGTLDRLLQLRGVAFEWRDMPQAPRLEGRQMGLIAQEVERVFPEWVGTDPQGYKELTITGFEALTVEALRELDRRERQTAETVETLEARVSALEKPGKPPARKRPAQVKGPKTKTDS